MPSLAEAVPSPKLPMNTETNKTDLTFFIFPPLRTENKFWEVEAKSCRPPWIDKQKSMDTKTEEKAALQAYRLRANQTRCLNRQRLCSLPIVLEPGFLAESFGLAAS